MTQANSGQPGRSRFRSTQLVAQLAAQQNAAKAKLKPDATVVALQECARKALESSGPSWHPGSDVTVQLARGRPLRLDLVGFQRIVVSVDLAATQKRSNTIPKRDLHTQPLALLEETVTAMVGLWAGHFDICPYDSYRHELLCRASAEGGFGTLQVSASQWSQAAAIACFFERNIVAYRLVAARGVAFARGLALEHLLNGSLRDLLDDLFFKIQSVLAPDYWRDVLCRYPIGSHDTTAGLLRDVLPLVSGSRLRVARRGQVPHATPGRAVTEQEWPKCVRRLAELLIPYLEGASRHPDAPFVPPRRPSGSQPGAQAPERTSRLSDPQGGSLADASPPPSGSAFAEPGDTQRAASGPRPGTEPGHARYYDFDQLDSYYKERAAALPVETDVRNGESQRKPELLSIGYLDSEPVGLAAIGSGLIDWSATRTTCVDGKRELHLRSKTDPLEIRDEGGALGDVRPPHLCLMCDSSGSMKFNPGSSNLAARGKYDVVLSACFGMFAHIQTSGLADCVQVACINFSGRSIESGWQQFRSLRRVKEILFEYQGGGTKLRPQAVRRVFESRPAEFLAVLITDGCISEVPTVVAELRRLVESECDVMLLHVGAPNAFTQSMEKVGTVHVVQTANDLVGLSLRIAREKYRRLST